MIITLKENQTEKHLKRIISDNGEEFLDHKLGTWFKEKGITHELSCEQIGRLLKGQEHY